MGDDWGNCGENQDDVAENGDTNGDADSLVATPVLVGHVGAEKWHAVDPEGVEGVDAIGGLRTLA